ncbi:phage tail fiber protein [Vreelandella massiliensis]|uniref:phage tail fiber protein n=1 Tax=Vreelandella massiliensis TaxID=1816686 RepID=UPI00096A95F5|nr:hypothetical protein [Halomonas massiliensis]
MAAFSDHLEEGILNHTLRGQALSTPATIYMALFTTDPTDAASGNEVTDSAYVRQDMAKGETISSGWTSPSTSGDGTEVSNAKVIQFPPVADGTVTASHYGLYDAQTGGNLLYHGAFTVAKTLEINDVLSIDIGGVKVIVR